MGDLQPARPSSNLALPKLIEELLGRGLNGIQCKYDTTFYCNSEKGHYTEVESQIFSLWKKKLQKHEEKTALMANYTYRNVKRTEKAWIQKTQALQEAGMMDNARVHSSIPSKHHRD